MRQFPLFNDESLMRQALTHRSYANENPEEAHNERLEFLGDAILNFISGDYLYHRYPEIGEDEMTRRRSALVDEKQLAQFAKDAGLDLKMRLGRGAIYEGGYHNPNLQSSTFEAVIGAYYLDQDRNIEKVRPVVELFFDSVITTITQRRSNVDSKNRFQEWVQANLGPLLPRYETERIGGPDHAPEYLSRVFVNSKVYGKAKGCGRKEAEKWAAEDALAKLKARGMI